jgi:spore protease
VSKMRTFRTDLADEIVESETSTDIYTQKKSSYKGININHIIIHRYDESIGKIPGDYYSIEFPHLNDEDVREAVKEVVSDTLQQLLNKYKINDDSVVFVAGLGNSDVTPDALGPVTTSNVIVTKHLFDFGFDGIPEGTKKVAVLTPGVMGQTGIETSDIVNSVCNEIKPDCVIVIDALASRSIKRVNKVIQITDAGINPGSGVKNNRKEISKEVLGIPVIAIGVATVVEIMSIIDETFRTLMRQGKAIPDIDTLYNYYNEDELGMIVTPKEIDEQVENIAVTISDSINMALHRNLDQL